MHADVLIGLPVHHDRRRHLDVRVVEGGELLFPIVPLEPEEDRPQRPGVVERLAAVDAHVGRQDLRAGHGRLGGHAAAASGPRPPARAAGGQPLAGGLPLGAVEPVVPVSIEASHDRLLGLRAEAPSSAAPARLRRRHPGRILDLRSGCRRGARQLPP